MSRHAASARSWAPPSSRRTKKPSPGKSLHWLDPDSIFRRAGTALLYEVAVSGHDVHDAHALLDRLNVISATYYERRASRGQIVIARPDHPCVRQKLCGLIEGHPLLLFKSPTPQILPGDPPGPAPPAHPRYRPIRRPR